MADNALLGLGSTDFVMTIVRAPAIFGGKNGQNIRKLMRFMARFRFFIASRNDPKRSALSAVNLARLIETIFARKISGVVIAGDGVEISVTKLAKVVRAVTGRSVFIAKLPWIFLLPVRLVSRELYNSLFEQQLVAPTLPPKAFVVPPVTPAEALTSYAIEVFGRETI